MGSDWVNGWSMGSDSIDTKLTWTPRGQLASMKKGSGEAGVKSSIKHLSMNSGQLTSMTYPSGRKLHYSYNAMGRIAKITITAGGQTQVLAKDIAYLPFGGITGLDYGNGTHLSQTYNQDYRLTKTETSNGFSRKYTYDADGNATVLTNTVSRPATPMAVSMAPDSNHIQSLSLNGGPYNPVTYDAAGRTVRQAGLKYVYYPSGRLFAVQSENADGSAQSLAAYAYSGLGRRVVTVRLDTPAQQTRHFMYDAAGHLIGVYQADGAPVHEIAYLNGRPLALFKGGNIYTIQTDRKDTPREIANAQGDVIWYLGGSAFDNFVVLYPQDVTIKLHLHLRFPGQYFDPASGNHYNGHRYYVPTTGRYLTPDPIGLAGGINPYRYVGDNPVNFADPLGLYRSNPFLRAIVPGQVAFDHAVTALQNGNYLAAGASSATALGEQVLYALTLGRSSMANETSITRLLSLARRGAWNLKFDGPSRGLRYGNGRVCQIRYKTKPILRIDYHPYPGTRGQSRLHGHFGARPEGQHIPLDPRVWFK